MLKYSRKDYFLATVCAVCGIVPWIFGRSGFSVDHLENIAFDLLFSIGAFICAAAVFVPLNSKMIITVSCALFSVAELICGIYDIIDVGKMSYVCAVFHFLAFIFLILFFRLKKLDHIIFAYFTASVPYIVNISFLTLGIIFQLDMVKSVRMWCAAAVFWILKSVLKETLERYRVLNNDNKEE